MKIFGKRIGKFLNIVFSGKPKTIETKSKEEMEHLVNLTNKANAGDIVAQKELEEIIFKEPSDLLESNEIKQAAEIVNNIEKNIDETTEIVKLSTKYDEIKKSDYFEVVNQDGVEKVYLKGYKSELPPILVDKFVSELINGNDITDLVQFWQLNLLNENPEARRGLYNFITRQKLFVAKHGYFVFFRRILKVNSKDNVSVLKETENDDYKKAILEFSEKIKKWKKNKRQFEVYRDDKAYLLKPIKDHAKNTLSYKFIGILHDCFEGLKLNEANQHDNIVSEQIYTDAFSKSMIIRIGEPVRMNRAKCNKDSHVECSFGLHGGSQAFVKKNSSNGDTIVACLVNPMHVISVPYKDAHKMRVCEYLPFMVLTEEELMNFDKIDISQYADQYKAIEKEKLKKSIEIFDSLSNEEIKKFSIERTFKSIQDIEKLQKELEDAKLNLSNKKNKIKTLLDDDICQSLDIDEVKKIIQSRIE